MASKTTDTIPTFTNARDILVFSYCRNRPGMRLGAAARFIAVSCSIPPSTSKCGFPWASAEGW